MFTYVFIGILAFISIVYFIKLFRESRFNFLLKNKQKELRTYEPSPVLRRATWIKALVPAMTIAVVIALNPQINPSTNIDLNEIKSEDDILNIYKEFQENQENLMKNGFFGFPGGVPDMMVVEEAAADDGAERADEYSETNIQVEGVDEIDNVKTDGTYIYSISNGNVVVTLAYPADQLSVHKVFEFESNGVCEDETCVYSYPQGMYVDDDRLVVIASQYTYTNYAYYKDAEEETTIDRDSIEFYEDTTKTVVYVYDKTDFELEGTYYMTGYMVGTRKINEDLYIITNTYINYAALEEYEEYDVRPVYSIDGEETRVEFDSISYIDNTDPYGMTNIFGIDLEQKEIDPQSMIGSSSYNLYVSTNNIYLTDYAFVTFGILETSDSETEDDTFRTTITRFELDGHEIKLAATGTVKGSPLNQFAMDEYKSNLRMTTTTGWGEDVVNRLYVLDENLDVVSLVGEGDEKIGKPNERLQSTRFMGDIAYMVTFEQTDPFYVYDLSDPENPTKLGELEITGFSTYIQQIDKNHVLGIGFEADEDGRRTGMKISVYEIDYETLDEDGLISVAEKHKEVISNTEMSWNWSSVTYNHKDLMFSSSKGVLGFPLSQSASDGNYWYYQSGFLVYDFDVEEGLEMIGYATHGEDTEYDYIYKGVFLDDNLYTISNNKIAVQSFDDVETIIDIINLK